MNDITWLRQELKQRGWDRKATGRVLLELALHLGVALSGITLFHYFGFHLCRCLRHGCFHRWFHGSGYQCSHLLSLWDEQQEVG